jgi:hypothetical protein
MDCQAPVHMGAFSRGGHTRGAHKASAHDLGGKEKYRPCGSVDDDPAPRSVTFGSAFTTRDCIVETLAAWWQGRSATAQGASARVPIKLDNGSASRGVRTPLLHRMGQCADPIGQPLQLLYDPPEHRKYKPLERCWGMMEWPWHGAQRIDVATMLAWAQRMTWQGVQPVVERSRTGDATGVSLSKAAMQAVAARLERHPLLPQWDLLIHPVGAD